MSKTKNRSRVLALVLMLALVLAILPMGAMATSNVPTYNNIEIQFGDPNFPATWPENQMSLVSVGGSTTNYDAVYGNGTSFYYPSIVSLYAFYEANDGVTLTSSNSNIQFVTFDQSGNELVDQDGSINYTQNSNWNSCLEQMVSSNLFAIKINAAGSITITNSDNAYVVINFDDPSGVAAPVGSTPKEVVSYLPIGQYATGVGWGSANGKFVNSFNSFGASLGALGGYIEFDFDDPESDEIEGIMNDPRNPYGVDFVVYGNAFGGNPEAGAVQVSETGDEWYELAGSLYYEGGYDFAGNQGASGKYVNAYSGTLRKTTVSYALTANDIQVTLGTDGPNTFTTVKNWWPTTSEYPEFANYATDANGNSKVHAPLSVNYGASTLSFGGVTAIPDSNTTAFYGYGYADVTPNGNPANYGDAVNPYIPYTNSKVGGDGFDLEWAVDITNGMPVDVTGKTFRFVRIYSAVLDNGGFGETSTEICGIFTAYLDTTETSSVGRTNMDSLVLSNFGISINNAAIATFDPTISYKGDMVIYDIGGLIEGDEIAVSGVSGCNVYMNNDYDTSYTVSSDGQFVRIIIQQGTAAPYIVLIK